MYAVHGIHAIYYLLNFVITTCRSKVKSQVIFLNKRLAHRVYV